MSKTLKIGGKDYELVPGIIEKVAATEQGTPIIGRNNPANAYEKLPIQLANDMVSTSAGGGKPYPGMLGIEDMRALSISSTVVDSIIKLRVHQVAKLPIKIVPKEEEPSRQISIMNYPSHALDKLPAFDDADKAFLRDVYDRLDPQGLKTQKRDLFVQQQEEFTPNEIAIIKALQDKHDDFYKKREADIKKIKKVLSRPDPHFTNTHNWNNLMAKVLRDLLTLDRGVIVKIRDVTGNIVGLMPVDGGTIRPVVYEYGFVEPDKAYVQNTRSGSQNFLDKKDVMVMMLNPVTDMRFFGYGLSPLETLYRVVLSDIYIDKGNIDYYRKGGTIPEIMLNLEPIPSKEGVVTQYSQANLDALQREIQAIMTGDFTQVPIISGAKVNVHDLKGTRRDMQFKELAEYIIRKICSVYQVSSQEVNLLEGFKSSDGEVQAEMTKSKGLHTLMISVSEYFTYEIIEELRPEGDLKLWFEEPEEKEADKNWGTQLKLQHGVLTINEVRAKMGLHPEPWGDTPLQNLQKNWEPTPDQGGAPGALPPLPGMDAGGPPPPGGPAGGPPPPGGPPGGVPSPSPFSGAGAPPVMKSVFDRIVELEGSKDYYDDIIVAKAADSLYTSTIKTPKVEADEYETSLIQAFRSYKGGELTRTPLESYSYLLKSAGLTDVHIQADSSLEDDVLMFSSYDNGSIIVGDEGDTSMPKTIAKALIDKKPEYMKALGMTTPQLEDALEFAVLESLDLVTRQKLLEAAYKYKPQKASAEDVRKAKEMYINDKA